jgi:hypothetical protein
MAKNNNRIYNAAVAGAGGGTQARWLTKTDPADYAAIAGEVDNFANALDQSVPAGTVSDADGMVIEAISSAVLSGRYLDTQSQAGLTAIAQASAALFQRLRLLLQPVPGNDVTSPVYVENYLPAAGGDIRTAIKLAWAANLAAGTTFVMPVGTYTFVGNALTLADGFRSNITMSMYGCELTRDLAGVASGQQIFFLRSEDGVNHAHHINFFGGKFSLLNALTSFFGYAVGIIGAQDCTLRDCEAYCTLDPAATSGKIRWGFALFGGDQTADPLCGTNNVFDRVKLTIAQIQGCAGPNSVNGVIVRDTQVHGCNDYAVSVVSSTGGSVRNVSILNTQIHDAAGSGGVFAGSDGAGTAIGADVVENLCIDGVWICGQRSTPNLSFEFVNAVIVDGGILTENVVVTNIGTKLVPNTGLQSKSVAINSQNDESSWHGLALSNLQLGVVTSNDPLEALRIAGLKMSGVSCVNVHVRGVRGIKIIDADSLTLSNCSTDDGTCSIFAESRNLSKIVLSNCCFTRASGFNPGVAFQSSSGKNMAGVMLSNITTDSNVAGIQTALTGGTMQMWISNFENTNGSNPTAETLAGIIRFSNLRGFTVPTLVSVVVPAVAAASVGYVNVSMAGTRLSDLFVGEGVVANPAAQLVAAGAGGGYINCRVQAIGSVECAFLGPLAGGAVNFNFNRAN